MGARATAEQEAAVDFALLAVREEGAWQVVPLPQALAGAWPTFLDALRQQPGDGTTLGFVSVGEDFFVAARVVGDDVRLLLSDAVAALDWPLAATVLDQLGVEPPPDDDVDEAIPAGDLGIFEDLGLPAIELSLLCHDLDLYPDEQIGSVAARIGFGEQYESVVDSLLG